MPVIIQIIFTLPIAYGKENFRAANIIKYPQCPTPCKRENFLVIITCKLKERIAIFFLDAEFNNPGHHS